MSEFKGTKGKWKADYGGEITSNNRFICDCATLTEEDRYNAQLISCAPEMLEALKVGRQAIIELMNHEEGWEDEYTYIDNLITKATTI